VNRLRLDPLIPDAWDNLKIHYRYRETFHHITIHNHRARKVTRVVLDGVEQRDKSIPLVDDRREHVIEIELGPE
jgi:cyclic beta-1,2-glucan synthetase